MICMDAAAFLASLPGDDGTALAEIEGALTWDGVGATLAPEERAALVTARLRLLKKGEKNAPRRGSRGAAGRRRARGQP